MTFERLFILGLLAHIVADWFLQNDWMAQHKTKFMHPAGTIHAFLHYVCAVPFFHWWAFAIAIPHYLIDLRTPLIWWRKFYRMKSNDPDQDFNSPHNSISRHVAFWQDQMAHVLVIGIVAWLAGVP